MRDSRMLLCSLVVLAACRSPDVVTPSPLYIAEALPAYISVPQPAPPASSSNAGIASIPLSSSYSGPDFEDGQLDDTWFWGSLPAGISTWDLHFDAHCGASATECVGLSPRAVASSRGNWMAHEISWSVALPGDLGGSSTDGDERDNYAITACLAAKEILVGRTISFLRPADCIWSDYTYAGRYAGSYPVYCSLRALLSTTHRAKLVPHGIQWLSGLAISAANRLSHEERWGSQLAPHGCLPDPGLNEGGSGSGGGDGTVYTITVCHYEAIWDAFGIFQGINELGCTETVVYAGEDYRVS